LPKGERNSDFDIYFWESMKHCLPMVYVENFTTLFDAYHKDILKRNFSYIASESWISDFSSSIYVATAKHLGKKFIAIEHAAGNVFLKNGLHFVDIEFADKFVTTGWNCTSKNVARGGFMSRDIALHNNTLQQKNILFVTFTRFIYWEEFNEENATDDFFLSRIERISKFIDLLPNNLRDCFVIRPRSVEGLWNVSNLISFKGRNIKVDREKYSSSINSARIIVIDHMSTGLAEILQNRIPFILLYNINNIPLNADLRQIFDQLIKSKVLHTTQDSAVEHLTTCYSEIETWWGCDQVQESIRQFTNYYLHPADRTIFFLAGLLKKAPHRKPDVFNCITIYICNAFAFCLRALRLVARHIFARRSFNN
jgi:putative transferase (TIGR04331 family)